MPITEKQRARRGAHVGASDVAPILGLSPWKTAYDVWLEKTGKVEAPASRGEAGEIGNMVENGLLDWGAGELGVKIIKNQARVHEGRVLSATHDALVIKKPEGLEAKTSGIMNPFAAKEGWGESGSDQVPEHILVQCQAQILVSKLEAVHVPALIGGRGGLMFHVERSETLCNIILERVTAFWEKNVLADVPPEGLPSVEIVRFRKREPGLVLPIPADLVARWQAIKEEKKKIEEAEDEAKAAVLAAMSEAEIGESEAGNVKVLKVELNRLDTKALKAEHPDIAAKFTMASESIRVTFTKAKLLKG
jgi:putative phage-type endonuclease